MLLLFISGVCWTFILCYPPFVLGRRISVSASASQISLGVLVFKNFFNLLLVPPRRREASLVAVGGSPSMNAILGFGRDLLPARPSSRQ